MDDVLLVTREGGVATLTLNLPGKANALTEELKVTLRDTLADVAADETVRAVVLTGAGKVFCVGQDLGEHAQALADGGPGAAFATVAEHYSPIVTSLATMPKPVVAAVNGTCFGAGLGFALACDVRIAADTVKFGTAFTAIGLTGDSGLTATLSRAVGFARASELLLLGEPFTADQAVAWGMVGRTVPADDLPAEAARVAGRLAQGPTQAYALTKQALREAWAADLAVALAAEGDLQARLGATEDHRGAVSSFLAKERPTFTGR